MALHILDREDPSAKLGTALGTGLGSGLKALAEHKIGQIKQRQQESAYHQILKQARPNMSPEELTQLSRSLSMLSPEDRKQFSKGLSQQLTGNDFQNNFLNELGLQSQAPAPQEAQQLRQVEQQQVAPQQAQRDEFTPPAPPVLKPSGAEIMQAKAPEKELPKEATAPRVQENVSKKDNLVSVARNLIQNGYPVPRDAKEKTELFKEAQKQLIEDRKLAFKEKQSEKLEERENYKTNAARLREAHDKAQEADEGLKSIKLLRDQEKKGLPGPGLTSFLKDTGFDVGNITGTPAEIVEKVTAMFALRIANASKGVVSNFKLENIMAQVPNLLQTPEGREIINSVFEDSFKLDRQYYNVIKDVRKENNGELPRYWEIEVDDKMEPYRKKFAQEFDKSIEDAAKLRDKSESPWTTAGWKVLGKGVNLLQSAASSAARAVGPAALGYVTGGAGGAGQAAYLSSILDQAGRPYGQA